MEFPLMCNCVVRVPCSEHCVKPQSQACGCYLQVSYPFLPFRPRPHLVTSCRCQSSVAEFTLGDVTEMCENDVMLYTRGDKTASHYLHVWHHFKTSYAHKNTQRYSGIIYYMLTCHFPLRFIFIWPDTYRGTVLTQFYRFTETLLCKLLFTVDCLAS